MTQANKDKDPGADVAASIEAANEARTKVDEKGLAKGETVDARLDNRSGAQRPRRERWPAVPQQIDGPDLAHQAEFTKAYLDAVEDESVKAGSRKGMHSPGPHGLGDEDERASKTDDAGDINAMKRAVANGFDSRGF